MSIDVSRGTAARARFEREFDHYGIPERLREGLAEYVANGRPTGSFLRSCLENNFIDAICRADDQLTVEQIRGVAKWIFNEVPNRCWGSPGVVKTWRGE